MLRIKVSTTTARKTMEVAENSTIKDVLELSGLNTQGATITLDGCFCDAEDTLEDLGAVEGSVISAIVKAQNA